MTSRIHSVSHGTPTMQVISLDALKDDLYFVQHQADELRRDHRTADYVRLNNTLTFVCRLAATQQQVIDYMAARLRAMEQRQTNLEDRRFTRDEGGYWLEEAANRHEEDECEEAGDVG